MATPPLCDTCGHAHELGVRCDICGHVGSAALLGMSWEKPSSCAPGCTYAEHVLPCSEHVLPEEVSPEVSQYLYEDRQRREQQRQRKQEQQRHEQEQQQLRDERERLAERKLKVRRTVADEVAALSASSSHMGDTLAQFALTELPREVLAVVMSHLKWRPASQQPAALVQQLKMLTFLTSSCGTDVRQCALQLLSQVQEAWNRRLATLSNMFSGVPDVLACVVEGVRAKRFVEQRPEAAPWLDPRLLDTWASLPAHCRVGALAVHMTHVRKRLDVLLNDVLLNGSPLVRKVCKQLRVEPRRYKRVVVAGIRRFTTALVAGDWYDAWYHDHAPPDAGDSDDEDDDDDDSTTPYYDGSPENDFSYDFAGYPAGVFALSTPPVAALLMDGWAAFMEQVGVMHAKRDRGGSGRPHGPVHLPGGLLGTEQELSKW